MVTIGQSQAFDAFQNQLKTLCLQEFPCGNGSWREYSKKNKKKIPTKLEQVHSHFTVTLKDISGQFEKTESLQELVQSKRSPWKLDYSWSNEAQQLREIAVKSPWLIDQEFVHSHFKTLRIIDKGVSEIDERLLQFSNLHELSLNANYIKYVDSRNLPRNLKVLELCANEISNLTDLCTNPPDLLHLGLGYNQISVVDDYITGGYWPSLLSLDLSHNHLSDLLDIVRKMQSLPKLRNLILQGNPLSLVPGYRGYTIDCLKKLNYLDDISISADEKHHYKGLSRRREYILDEAKIRFHVSGIKNLPMPEEMKFPEEQPEYPVVTRKYYIQFMFLEDKSSNAEIFQILHDDAYSETEAATQRTLDAVETDTAVAESLVSHSVDHHLESKTASARSQERNVAFGAESQQIMEKPVLDTFPEEPEEGFSLAEEPVEIPRLDSAAISMGEPEPEPEESLRLAPVKSASSTWAEEIELNWTEMVARDDLLGLRDFFKEGMEIKLMEDKILSYPADQMQDGMPSPTGSHKSVGKEGKKEKADKKEDKGKKKKPGKEHAEDQDDDNDGGDDDDKGAQKEEKKPEEKKKKKKGEPEVELVHMPPEVATIATFHIQLDHFLEGEYDFEKNFVHDVSGADDGSKSPASTSSKKETVKKEKKKPSSAKKKDGKDAKDKDGRKSATKGDKKDAKDKKGKSNTVVAEDEEALPPPPVEFYVKVQLHHWKTARDSMREEQPSEAEETQDGATGN